VFHTPSGAVRGFMQLVRYARAQEELMQAPPALPGELTLDPGRASAAIAHAVSRGRSMMTEPEAKDVLAAYGIPTVPTFVAKSPEEVETAAASLLKEHTTCVVKILSEDLTHKSDLGGVRLDIETAEDAGDAARQMLARIRHAAPHARIEGFTVQPMVRKPDAYEVILGITSDATFGPVILFGAGGTAVEAVGDTAMALPPLDLKSARAIIQETRIYKLLRGFRGKPPVDLDGLALTLVKVSSLAMQQPAILELDINPLLIDSRGMIALDARIQVTKPGETRRPPAIRPYPVAWEAERTLIGGENVLLRPIRPEDVHLYEDFLAHVTAEDLRLRMFTPMRTLPPGLIARLTQIDYAREMAFIALDPGDLRKMLGVVRFFADPDYTRGEYAVMLRSDLKGRGLGWALMQHLIAYARAEGLQTLFGSVLRENRTMLAMCAELGFNAQTDPDDPLVVKVVLDLTAQKVAEAAG
jgi:acetyltransferase